MQEKIIDFLVSIVILGWILVMFIPSVSTYLLEKKVYAEDQIEFEKRFQAGKIALEKSYLTGRFDPANMKNFVQVPAGYKITDNDIYLRKEALGAFIEMAESAKNEGITLLIASATRNFDYQKMLWENKWLGVTLVEGKNLSKVLENGVERAKKILDYSAAPSTSRHHFGTDIDINGADTSYFDSQKGQREYEWLRANANRFGFCQTYDGLQTGGYREEKWHWSYLPLARNMTKRYIELIDNTDITGFPGDVYVRQLNVIDNYVAEINPNCL